VVLESHATRLSHYFCSLRVNKNILSYDFRLFICISAHWRLNTILKFHWLCKISVILWLQFATDLLHSTWRWKTYRQQYLHFCCQTVFVAPDVSVMWEEKQKAFSFFNLSIHVLTQHWSTWRSKWNRGDRDTENARHSLRLWKGFKIEKMCCNAAIKLCAQAKY